MDLVLVAGATGALGRGVVAGLRGRGLRVRALTRSRERGAAIGADELHVADATRPGALAGACDGASLVFSCMGQSVGADMANRGPGYRAVDYVGNRALIAEARRAGVRRLAYVSVFGADAHPRDAYMRAHADVADELRRSGMGFAVVQPTGFFSAYAAFFEMAARGRGVLFGSGEARTNPIHDADLAEVCCEALLGGADGDVPAGGPDVLTRREVFDLAFAALGRPPRLSRLPAWAPGAAGAALRPIAPRVGELTAFLGVVGAEDFVAPARGARRLADYYADLARRVTG